MSKRTDIANMELGTLTTSNTPDNWVNVEFAGIVEEAARSAGVAAGLFIKKDSDWVRIPPEANPSTFCAEFRKRCPDVCKACDATRADRIVSGQDQEGLPYVCEAGLIDFAFPIFLGTRVYAVLFGGQVYLSEWPDFLRHLHCEKVQQRAPGFGKDTRAYEDWQRQGSHLFHDLGQLCAAIEHMKAIARICGHLLKGHWTTSSLAYACADIATSFGDRAACLSRLLDIGKTALGYDSGGILVPYSRRNEYIYACTTGFRPDPKHVFKAGLSEGFVGHVLESGSPLRLREIVEEGHLYSGIVCGVAREDSPERRLQCKFADIVEARKMRSFLAVPMLTESHPALLGVIEVSRNDDHFFDEQDEAVLSLLAAEAALVCRLCDESQHLVQLGTAKSLSEVIALMLERLVNMLPQSVDCTLFEWDREEQNLVLLDSTSPRLKGEVGKGYPRDGHGLTLSAALLDRSIWLPDVHDDGEVESLRKKLSEEGGEKGVIGRIVVRNGSLQEDEAHSSHDLPAGFLGVPVHWMDGDALPGVLRITSSGARLELSRVDRQRIEGFVSLLAPLLRRWRDVSRETQLTDLDVHTGIVLAASHDIDRRLRHLINDVELLEANRLPEIVVPRIVDGVRLLSRIVDQAFGSYPPKVVNFDDAIREYAEAQDSILSAQSIDFRPHYKAHEACVYVSPDVLRHFVAEGFTNAATYLRESGKGQKRRLWLRTQLAADGSVNAEIEDNGPGPQSADPFGDKKVTFRRRGLVLLRSGLEQFGGKCYLTKRRQGSGSVLRIQLPVVQEKEGGNCV